MIEREAVELLALCERAAPELVGLDARRWQERLEPHRREFEPAVCCLLECGRRQQALALAVSLTQFWIASGRCGEGGALLERALAGGEGAMGYFEAGMLSFWEGEDDQAREWFTRGVALGRRLDDRQMTAVLLTGLARLALRDEDVELARALCNEALELCGEGNKLGRSNAVHVLGVAAQMAGDLMQARELMSTRMRLARETGNFKGLAGEASNLSAVERQLGNLERAAELAREATQLDDRRGDRWSAPYNLNALAAIAAERNELERAARLIGAAAAEIERQGAAWPPDERQHLEHTRALLATGLDPATFERCQHEGATWKLTEAIAYALEDPQS